MSWEKIKLYKEPILYLFFGGLTFFLNIGLFLLLNTTLGMNELIANIICWIVCVLFQFFTNRSWVFDARTDTVKEFGSQMIAFFSGRLFTLAVEEAIIFIFITLLSFASMPVKLAAQVIVIVLNYIISKRIVFK